VSEYPILVVDDDEGMRETIAEMLEIEGYPVVTAANGAEALEAIDRARPSLVLLDMRMPVLDGWGFARKLKERRIKVPILVMTATQDAQQWAEQVGAQGFLPKPFEFQDLVNTVGRLRNTQYRMLFFQDSSKLVDALSRRLQQGN
jgi:two-component system, chemotaxis family, chemotaxis protein CheY